MMHHTRIAIAGFVTALVLSGCLDGTASITGSEVETPFPRHEPSSEPSKEFEMTTTYAVSAAGMTMSDMASAHYSDVPENTSNVTIRITWTRGAGVGEQQHCMLHDGTGGKMGATLMSAVGASPLVLGPTNLAAAVTQLALMCGTSGEPGAAVNHVVHVVMTFRIRSA